MKRTMIIVILTLALLLLIIQPVFADSGSNGNGIAYYRSMRKGANNELIRTFKSGRWNYLGIYPGYSGYAVGPGGVVHWAQSESPI